MALKAVVKSVEIISKYKSMKDFIIVKDNYGLMQLVAGQLYYRNPTIKCAINKTEYWINMAKEIHGDKYDYSLVNYKNSRTKVKIICPEHGIFYIIPSKHLMKKGCQKCAFIKRQTTSWSYSDWIESAKNSEHFDSFKVYIIKCWNENEEFYKIGKTFMKIEKRFRSTVLPYSYKILMLKESKNANYICKLEQNLLNLHIEYKYCPKLNFSGKSECFSKIIK